MKIDKTHIELIKAIPDFSSWDDARRWVREGQTIAQRITPKQVLEAEIKSLEWSDIEQKKEFPFGLYASQSWRKFVLATFLADLASYEKPSDQVNFERLLFVMHAFPQGFRTWWIKLSNELWWPMDYTGWYPMFETMYELMKKNPGKLRNRMVLPNTYQTDYSPYLYLFNFSVAPLLKKSNLSNALMKSFILDICGQKAGGMACITVSGDGIRIANRLGMMCTGYLSLADSSEGVFIK